MIPEKRYQLILQLLQEEKAVKASELAQTLGTSYETIRRDLNYLESQGQLKRSSGGAVLVNKEAVDSVYQKYSVRSSKNTARKKSVAALAVRYVSEGEVIALDSGTTSVQLALLLREQFSRLTIVTNSLKVVNALADKPGFTIIITGGTYRADEGSFVAENGAPILSHIIISTFFLTTCGISAEKGVTYQRIDELPAQKRMMECAEKTIAITDSSKLGVNSLIQMCDIRTISCILTDAEATDEQVRPFIAKGIPVVHD